MPIVDDFMFGFMQLQMGVQTDRSGGHMILLLMQWLAIAVE